MQRLVLLLLGGILLLLPLQTEASDRYDPRLRFRTISTARFDIHYHQGLEDEARRLAHVAEEVASRLDATLGPASGRVQVILVNQSDLSNGWATPLPFNTIEITSASPSGATFIGNTNDWLRLVFTHEYTHIVHLTRGRGWIGGLRYVFGRMPLLYPNLYLPQWQIEGLATYEESALTGVGRVHDGSFRTLLEVASARPRFEPLDRVGGGLVDWPGGNASYVYGSYFHQFLRDKYGEESLARLTNATAGRVPYFGAPAFRRVFNRSLGELWDDFEAAPRDPVSPFSPSVTRLTRHGFSVSGPRFAPDGRLFYSIATPHEFPALMTLDADGAPKHVTHRYLGGQIGFAGSLLVFDAIEIENQVGLQSDLYAIATDGSHRRRLTAGARVADPDVSPDGRRLVVTVQRADRRELATAGVSADGTIGPLETLASESLTHYASPRWSPDGRWIAAEGLFGELAVIDVASRKVFRTIRLPFGGRIVTPAWLPDGSLLVASDQDGAGFRLYRLSIESVSGGRLEGTGPDARSPEVSPDGRTLVFVGQTADGFDLFSMPLDRARWTSGDDRPLRQLADYNRLWGEQLRMFPLPDLASRTYSPWKTLAPRFWTPVVESNDDRLLFGAATWAADALGRHAYAAQAAWEAARGRPDWTVSYVYDRWRPTLFASVSDETDPWRDGEIRTREGNAGALVPFRRVRWSQSLLGALHASTDELLCSDCPSGDRSEIVRRAVRAGWSIDAARSFGYSISREEGWTAATTTELTREALGSDGDGGSTTADVRGYFRVAPRHAAIAMRAAAASAWGDDSVRRVFSASGQGPQPGGFRFESDAIGLLRGVEDDELVGRHAVVLNADYRIPLMRIDRGAGTLPVFARAIHGALFVDAGNAWDDRFRGSDVTVSVGAELSLDAVLGYVQPLTFTAGGAWVSHERGFTVFGRIGRAF
jgi:dipeptidyl aminopeptidase/acylaminoacyl peptidase